MDSRVRYDVFACDVVMLCCFPVFQFNRRASSFIYRSTHHDITGRRLRSLLRRCEHGSGFKEKAARIAIKHGRFTHNHARGLLRAMQRGFIRPMTTIGGTLSAFTNGDQMHSRPGKLAGRETVVKADNLLSGFS